MRDFKTNFLRIAAIVGAFAFFASANANACASPQNCKHHQSQKKSKKHSCKHHKNHGVQQHSMHAHHAPTAINPPKNIPPVHTSCKAEQLQGLVGKNKKVLETMRFDAPIRIEVPGMMYTMEYSAERTRFITDDKGIIMQIICG